MRNQLSQRHSARRERPARGHGRAVAESRRASGVPLIVPGLFLFAGLALWAFVPSSPAAGRSLRGDRAGAKRGSLFDFSDPARAALDSLRVASGLPHGQFVAGTPRFVRVFFRDSIVSALIAQDRSMLEDILGLAVERQGTKADALTGEEPGKIPHELPGVQLNGHSTLFSACDTTALFMIGTLHAMRLRHGLRVPSEDALEADALWQRLKPAFQAALAYITRHLQQAGQAGLLEAGAFAENPAFAGAAEFALPSTYWKARIEVAPSPQRLSMTPPLPAAPTHRTRRCSLGRRASRSFTGLCTRKSLLHCAQPPLSCRGTPPTPALCTRRRLRP